MLRLHLNECPSPPPEDLVTRALSEEAPSLNRYPDQASAHLRERYAAYATARPEQVVPTSGGDEAIDLTILALRSTVEQVVVQPPTFTEYARAAKVAGLPVTEVPLDEAWAMDLDRLTEAARRRPSLVFICSPNNPTGGALQVAEALDRLAAAAPGTFVVVDEAYWEFAGATALPLLESHPNLILIRTMSKAFCLAGLRLGFAIAHPDVAARLDTARMLFNIGALTAAVGAAALRDAVGETPYVREVVRSVTAGRERLAEGLASLPGVHPYPSLTNFVLCRAPVPGPDLARAMRQRGVLVRAYPKDLRLDHHLRITVGAPAAIDRCLVALRESLAEADREGRTAPPSTTYREGKRRPDHKMA